MIISVLLIAVALMAILPLSYGQKQDFNPALGTSAPFDYLVVILMEGEQGGVGGSYMNQLAYQYSSANNYRAVSSPSLPNYLAL